MQRMGATTLMKPFSRSEAPSDPPAPTVTPIEAAANAGSWQRTEAIRTHLARAWRSGSR